MESLLKRTSLLLLMVGACLVGLPVNAQNVDTYDLDETYGMSNNGTIKLQSDNAHVSIVGSERNNVRLIVHYRLEVKGFTIGKRDKFGVEVTEQAGDLIINEKSRNFRKRRNIRIGYVDQEYNITIEAPQGASLTIQGDDDAYEITGINGNIRMDTDDSDIYLRRCGGKLFRFDFDDGDLVMVGGRGELRMSYDDGTADVRNGNFSWINVDHDDGSIDMSAHLTQDGDYTFTTDDGQINLNILGGGGEFTVDHDGIQVVASSSFQQLRSDKTYNVYRLPGGNARVRIETDDGQVRLNTP